MRWATTLLIVCVAALLTLGTVMLYSSPNGAPLLSKQLFWCAMGAVAFGFTASLDYRQLKRLTWVLLPLTLLLLALVLIIGTRRGGAMRWFDLGVFMFQPSELAKLTVILALAHYADRHQRFMSTFSRGLVVPATFIVPVLALIFVEPDYGATLLLAAVCGIMLLIAGVRWIYLLPVMACGLATIGISIWHNPLRLKRIMAFLHPEEHKAGVGYQAYQAILALGNGGLTGLGLGDGRQKLGFVPENMTDFIFSIIGEELGLIATLLVVLAFVVILFTAVCIAWNARDRFGLLLGSGLGFLIALQAFINIGVVTSVLPNKGLPLPFVSYGGSNLVIMLVCVGLLLSIARHSSVASELPQETVNPDEVNAPQLS